MIWLYFILVAAVIIWAGSKLSVYADVLADKFNLSHSTVGILLVSMVTTLPEISTTLGAVVKVGDPNLALGNNLGSFLFNLSIIAICDLVFRKGDILQQASRGNIKHAALSMLLLGVMLTSLMLPIKVSISGHRFGLGSIGVIVMYLIIFFKTHHDGGSEDVLAEDRSQSEMTKAKAIFGFSMSAVVVIAMGILLAIIGDKLAQTYTFMSGSFVGTLFLAIATSLPELTVGISSVRMGAYDLMMGNIMGANMLNVLVIGLADLVYGKEALQIPDNLTTGQLFTGVVGIIATCVVMIGIARKKKDDQKKVLISLESALLFVLHLGCMLILFRFW